jgi:hypothetical protein
VRYQWRLLLVGQQTAQTQVQVVSLMPQRTMFDDIAQDLADWIDRTANEIALAMAPRGVQPFAAQMTSQQKLDYYRWRLFRADGSPNNEGRTAEIQRLGTEGFANVYKAVVQAYPELKPPPPPEVPGPYPPLPTPTGGP